MLKCLGKPWEGKEKKGGGGGLEQKGKICPERGGEKIKKKFMISIKKKVPLRGGKPFFFFFHINFGWKKVFFKDFFPFQFFDFWFF